MTLFVNPNVAAYSSHVNYLTAEEYLNDPNGVDTSQLVPMGTATQQTAALASKIAKASSMADVICRQILAATVDPFSGTYRVRRDRTIQIPLRHFPVLELDMLSVGHRPSDLVAMASAPDILMRSRMVMEVPVGGFAPGSNVYATGTYINGWPVALTTGESDVGDTTLDVGPTLGMYPGIALTIFDGASTEVIVPTVVPTSGPITLANPLTFDHAVGVRVTNLPPAVEQAVIALTTLLIKQPGAQAVVLDSLTGAPTKETLIQPGGMEDLALAQILLDPFTVKTPAYSTA